MLFHTAPFLWLLAITFVLHWSVLGSRRGRNLLLLAASLVFYARWSPWLVLLVVATALFDFRMALAIEATSDPAARRRRLVVAVAVPLALLAWCKYAVFVLAQVWPLALLVGAGTTPPALHVVLPLGISFYTFETIAYVVDVYRRRIAAERRVLDYALYLLFFPHLIAGPIVRPEQLLPQLRREHRLDWSRVELGVRLFVLGMLKKAVVADQLALVVDPIFATPGSYASATLWLAVIAYAIQIYCDFSGYSDMAIGAAHLFGIHLPVNFRQPYLAESPADFWRRWHVSLSTWLRDYLYVPLGGNRHGTIATYRNLLVTMLLGGLWHGAAWTFVVWGGYHGLLLAAHRAIPWPAWTERRVVAPLKIALTFVVVSIGWVFFRAASLADAGTILTRLAVPSAGLVLEPRAVAIVTALIATVLAGQLAARITDGGRATRALPAPLVAAGLAAGFLLAGFLAPSTGGAFIYFQF